MVKNSKWSAILSIICAITIFTSYAIAPEQPDGVIVVAIQVLFFTAIITAVLSLILSFLAFRKKEQGILKWVAPLLIVFILLVFFISFLLIVFSFF